MYIAAVVRGPASDPAALVLSSVVRNTGDGAMFPSISDLSAPVMSNLRVVRGAPVMTDASRY